MNRTATSARREAAQARRARIASCENGRDFASQLEIFPDALSFLLAFALSRLCLLPYGVVRGSFQLGARERGQIAQAVVGALGSIGARDAGAAGVAFFLTVLTASRVYKLDALLAMESAAPADSLSANTGLVAGVAFVFAPALILASIFIFEKRETIRGK